MQTKHLFALIHTRYKGAFKHILSPLVLFLLIVLKRCFFCESLILFVFYVCHADLPVPSCSQPTCVFLAALWSPAGKVFSCFCGFVTFPYGVLGQVWYLIVSIPELCLLPYNVTLPFLKKRSSSYEYKFYAKSH